MRGGYVGHYLYVDLTEQKVERRPLDEEAIKYYIGGNGIGVKTLWDGADKEADAFDPKNPIIFASGPLTGTLWPASSRLAIIAKSPLTGIYGDTNSGGFFAPEMKFAGIDYVVVTGKSPHPVYLFVTDEGQELRDAKDLWGQGTFETEEKLRAELRDPNVKVACIGPAGEKMVRYACVQVSNNRSAGRAGMGAVMGAKNLKAIAVRGFGGIKLDRPEEFYELAMQQHKNIQKDFLYPMVKEFGSPGLTPLVNMTGRFPTKNFQFGSFDQVDKIAGEALHENHWAKHLSCFGCSVGCDKLLKITKGEYAGTVSTSLEYEALGALGSGCGNSHLSSIVRGNYLCDDLGMDVISAGRTISMLMELYEKGLIGADFADGIPLDWGNYGSVLALIEKIAQREGVGDLLAEGVKRMAEKIGGEAGKYAIHVKGMEVACQDGRGQQSIGLAHAVSARGADHLKAYPTIDETGYPSDAISRFGEKYMPELIDPHASKHKGLVVKELEDFSAVVDSAGHCKIGGTFVIPVIFWKEEAEALKLATGISWDEDSLRLAGERIQNLMRCYNVLHGISKKDDTLPERMLKEPNPSGTGKGNVCRLDEMLDEYYELRGWDVKTGIPSRERLEKLGLHDAVKKLL